MGGRIKHQLVTLTTHSLNVAHPLIISLVSIPPTQMKTENQLCHSSEGIWKCERNPLGGQMQAVLMVSSDLRLDQ